MLKENRDQAIEALEIAAGYAALVANGIGNMPILKDRAKSDCEIIGSAIAGLQALQTTRPDAGDEEADDALDYLTKDGDYDETGRAAIRTIRAALKSGDKGRSFQSRVQPWMMACFGPEIAGDKTERNHRFLEEALELVQSAGCTKSEAQQLVDYVYCRPTGEIKQESGGVMVTHAALCLANGIDMHENGETELARIWTKVPQIRAKQAAKPRNSPLPSPPTSEGV